MSQVGLFDPRHEWQFFEDFLGGGTFGASPSEADPWDIADTSSAGTPTYVRVDLGESTVVGALGNAKLSFDSQSEAQNVCLSWADKLGIDFDKLRGFECRVRMAQATADSATQLAVGITGDRHDTIDTIAIAAIFRVVGSDSTTALVVETDDGSADNDDVATGTTLINAWKVLRIDFTDKADVKFYVDEVRVASATTFSMAAHTGGVQPFFQLQKGADNNTDSVEIDYVFMWGVR